MAPPGQRRGSSSLFDRVMLAMRTGELDAPAVATQATETVKSDVAESAAVGDGGSHDNVQDEKVEERGDDDNTEPRENSSGDMAQNADDPDDISRDEDEFVVQEITSVANFDGEAETIITRTADLETAASCDESGSDAKAEVVLNEIEGKSVENASDSHSNVDVSPVTPVVGGAEPVSKSVATSPRTSARLFGRLFSTMRNEISAPVPKASETKLALISAAAPQGSPVAITSGNAAAAAVSVDSDDPVAVAPSDIDETKVGANNETMEEYDGGEISTALKHDLGADTEEANAAVVQNFEDGGIHTDVVSPSGEEAKGGMNLSGTAGNQTDETRMNEAIHSTLSESSSGETSGDGDSNGDDAAAESAPPQTAVPKLAESAPLQTEVPKFVATPPKQSGLFDRFVSAMRTEPSFANVTSTAGDIKLGSVAEKRASTRENGNRASLTSGISALLSDRDEKESTESKPHVELDVSTTPVKETIRSQHTAPASSSLFDRLIQTVRHEMAPTESGSDEIETKESAHTEITMDNGHGDAENDDANHSAEVSEVVEDVTTPHPPSEEACSDSDNTPQANVMPEAAAIEEMVELTLDVGGDDNETPISETSVTNEIEDAVDQLDPEENRKAIRRVGSSLLSIFPDDVVKDIPIKTVLPSSKEEGTTLENPLTENATDAPTSSSLPDETSDKNENDGHISTKCFEAIQHMASSGEPLGMEFVKELETCGVLGVCANAESPHKASETKLAELRAASAASCSGRLAWIAIPEVLALWSVVHTSVSSGIGEDAGERATALEPFELIQAAENSHVSADTLKRLTIEKDEGEKAEADNSILDEQVPHAALSKALSGLNGPLLLSRQHLATAFQAMREGRAALLGGCLALVNIPPLLRLEIVRDFFQTSGLFLSGLFQPTFRYFEQQKVPNYVSMLVKGLRAAYRIIAIDVSAFIQWVSTASDIGVFCSIGFVMLLHFSFILWLYRITRYMPRGAMDVRHGHEAVTWASLAATNKRMAAVSSILITAALTAYLPLTQLCFSVLDMESHKDDKIVPPDFNGMIPSDFVDKPYWGLIVFEAIALLITFSIPLPFVLMWSIRSNRPRGSLENANITHDLDGEEVKFDDKVYARLVSSDPSQLRCPYRSLYNGFEQRWSSYKVVQLIAKSSLAFIIVVSARNVSMGGIVVCGFYGLIVIYTTYSQPFIDPVNDLMESSAKFTALATALGATGAAWAEKNNVESTSLKTFLAFVMFVHFVNMWLMLTVVFLGVANTRTLIKNWLGWLSFSDTTRMIDDARAYDIIPKWDLNKEAKHRIWQAFWRAILYDVGSKPVEEIDVHNELAVKDSPAAARLMDLDQAVVTAGIRRVSSHWRGKQQSYTIRLRQVVRTALEGIDVYWDDATGTRDGHLDSKSCFGKMYVVPYPFHCVIVYDNTDDETIICDAVEESAPRNSRLHSNLAKLLFLNFSPRIVAKRELRQKIRVLAADKALVKFPFSRVEKAWVKDSMEVKPIDGGRPVKIHWWRLVDFTCHYTYGVFKVKTSGDSVVKGGAKRVMADGFVVSLTYKDGKGIAKAPRTGERFEVTGRKAVMDSDHFGLNPDMEENELLKGIFDSSRSSWEPGLKKLRAQHRVYRRKLIEMHAEANDVLSDDFWYFVYNNQYLSRKDLEQYLTTRETNPMLRQLPKTHATALDALYLRQRFIMLSPAHKLWYIFWDDVYARNSEMSKLIPKGDDKPGRATKSDFNPCSATSVCYKMMKRPALETWLDERGLRGKASMFHPGLIQLLYDQMEKANAGDPKNMKLRPAGRSFKRRSMIASMVWRPTA